jgi:hypothetical protein
VNAFGRGRNPEYPKHAIDDYGNCRLPNPSKRKRCDGDSELGACDVTVEVLERALNVPCARVSVVGHLIDPAAPDGNERELGSNEKRVQGYQKQNDTEARGNFAAAQVFGRSPLQGQKIHIQ